MAVVDYVTECGQLPASWMQMLASCIVGYHDIAGVKHNRLNTLQWTDVCTALDLFPDCDTSHIDHERLLVENVFAIDDCNRLAIKFFHNQDGDWIDSSEFDCGDPPRTLLEMLAHCIVEYSGANKLNVIMDSSACASLTQLLDCDVNAIEAERLLVSNIFAVDDCDNLLIKIVLDTSTMTDFHTECTEFPQSFYQLLARCIVKYGNHYRLNIASVSGYCDDYHAFWTCANNHIEPERALCENLFATDTCGNLALKIYNNQSHRGQ